MANKVLDSVGLTYFWGKIKAAFASKVSSATNGNLVSLNSEGNITDSGIAASDVVTATPITYSALKTLRDGGDLAAGTLYRITDYTCTTAQENTQSAGHVFDILVYADDESHLNENAKAAHHQGDTYFANCNIEAWELKYCLDNDTSRFAWADTTNGKGVVYYMKDEWNNECQYDFKNIMFLRGQDWNVEHQEISQEIFGDCEEEYFYTFSCYDTENLQLGDASLKNCEGIIHDTEECSCFGNVIKIRKGQNGAGQDSGNLPAYLNNIVFFNTYETDMYYSCFSNVFETTCFDNTFGNCCYINTFGNYCHNNTFGTYCCQNSFGNYCYYNSFGNNFCQNSFGDECSINTFGNNLYQNTFGNNFCQNSFGDECNYNSFGNVCTYNSFGNGFTYNSLGNDCANNSFGNYCQAIAVFDSVLYCSVTGGSSSSPVKNAQILNGTKGTSSSNRLTITFAANKNYTQVAAKKTGGTLRIWNVADIDTTPTSGSTNPITSGGVYSALQDKLDAPSTAGTSGQVLTSDGQGGQSWQTPSGGGGGTATDVQVNGTSITSNNVANIVTNTAYNASSNKIATMSDLPSVPDTESVDAVDVDSSPTANSTNLVTSGGVYSALGNCVQKSNTAGLLKNDGTVDTNTYLTQHQDISGKADKATTLAGYGITDAKIERGMIILGSNTIEPLTSFTETDPTVPSWAKASTKPSYDYSEISNTPGNVSSFTNDAGYLTSSDVVTVYSGSAAPSSSFGSNGDIYIQTS